MVGDKMNFNNIRSDLAGESLDQLESREFDSHN